MSFSSRPFSLIKSLFIISSASFRTFKIPSDNSGLGGEGISLIKSSISFFIFSGAISYSPFKASSSPNFVAALMFGC